MWDVSTIKKGDFVDVLDTYDGGGSVRLWIFSRMKRRTVSFDLRFDIEFQPRWNEESLQTEDESQDSEHIQVKLRDGVSVLDPRRKSKDTEFFSM